MDCLGSLTFLDDKEWFVLLDEAGAITELPESISTFALAQKLWPGKIALKTNTFRALGAQNRAFWLILTGKILVFLGNRHFDPQGVV